ncbi:CRISPR-associated protein Csx16, partial [Candidatus Venteria ishoeyi]
YYHLSLNIPPDLRGKELSVEEMLACDARLEQYEIKVVTPK